MYPSLPHERVSFLFENTDLLYRAEHRKRLRHQFVSQTASNASAVDGAVCRAALVVDFIESEWFGVS